PPPVRRRGKGSKPVQNRQSQREYIVQLHQYDERYSQFDVDETERSAEGVERLRVDDATTDCASEVRRRVFTNELGALRIEPRSEKRRAGQKNIHPIGEEGDAVFEELRQQAR